MCDENVVNVPVLCNMDSFDKFGKCKMKNASLIEFQLYSERMNMVDYLVRL